MGMGRLELDKYICDRCNFVCCLSYIVYNDIASSFYSTSVHFILI